MAAKAGVARLASSVSIVPKAAPANSTGRPEPPGSLSERQVAAVIQVVADIAAVLNDIAAPAFIVSQSGAVLVASTAARTLPDAERECVLHSLARAVAGGPVDPAWELRRLEHAGFEVFLAVLTAPVREAAADDLLELARTRWHLTARQTEVLRLLARGLTNFLIADTLGIRAGTVEFHVKALFDKSGVSNRATLIVKLVELGRR
jgi:DNA-binding CsgD family transcriptional regulator